MPGQGETQHVYKAPPVYNSLGTKTGKETPDNGGPYGSVNEAAMNPRRWLWRFAQWAETSEDTDPAQLVTWCCEDFKSRRLKAPCVLAWLVMQTMTFIYQAALLSEISNNLDALEMALTENCGPAHRRNGVCLGPTWNMSFDGKFDFSPTGTEDGRSDFDFVIPADRSFAFETASRPPTFLVGVEPQAPQTRAAWLVSIAPRTSGSLGFGGKLPDVHGVGSKYTVLRSQTYMGPAWSGSVSLRGQSAEAFSMSLFVVDSRIKHLEDIHSQEQCSFEGSWQNFSARHSGQQHRVLTFAQHAVVFFLLISVLLLVLVSYRFFYYVESGKLLSRVIAFKFVVQDIPQQMCIVAYLYAWYSTDGLRCQMCLFHPQHCDGQHPLHWSNLLVCIFTLLGACSNQLLLQAKLKKYDEEEECFLCFARCAALSVSVLPFSSSLFLLSASLLHLRSVIVYLLAGIPSLIGWGTVLCVPMFAICDDESL